MQIEPIREAANHAFVRHWLAWRGDRLLPGRADLDLNAIRPLLPRLMLFEMRAPDDILVRVAGTQLREDLEIELTGRNYVEVAAPERRAIRSHRMWSTAHHPCASRLIREHRLKTGRVALAEVVTLPFDALQPGEPRLLLTHFVVFGQRYEAGEAVEPAAIRRFDVVDEFCFLDIGAGVPASTTPRT